MLALLPKGCTVTLGEAHPLKPQFKQLLSVDEGAAIPALPADTVGWVYAPELTGNTVANKAKDTEQALTLSHQGLNVRQEGKLTGTIIGVLPRGATLKVGEKQSSGYCKVLEVMDYRGVPALPNGPDGKPLGYVFFDELDAQQSKPINRGHVHLLPEPHAIKAGELIGHIGLYQNQGESTAKPRLHLEVFSCEDVPAFIAKSRTLAASLPAEQKTLLKIHKGASKLIPHREDISASNPPKITDTGVTVAVELTIPGSVLESLPTERKIQVSETVPGCTTPRITHWWRLDNLLADADGNRISGWLAEQDMITTRHSPWEWEGFDFISETACAADHLACHLATQRLLTEEEEPDYQAQISTADHGPIKARLYDIIDGADGSVRDNILSVEEIKAALSKPWHAQSISRLITHYESEWFWKQDKWDELDKLMAHTEEDPNPQWVKEKERIKKLCWWSELAGQQEINEDGKVWHFHPAGAIELLSRRKHPIINLHGESVELEFLNMYEGGELSDADIRSAASDLNCEPGLIYAIARQESAHSSFIVIDNETIPSILYERHWFKKISQNSSFGETHPEIYGTAYKRARRDNDGKYISTATGAEIPITDVYGPTGRFQYERLITAYRLNETAALQACSWGKFQIMGFNYAAAGFNNVKDFTAAMSLGDTEHIKAFLKFAKSNVKLHQGLREKNFELIAEGHNGAAWRSINPDYAGNIEKFYNEYSNAK